MTRSSLYAMAGLCAVLWPCGAAHAFGPGDVPQPAAAATDPRVQAIEQLPGLYKVASQGGLVGDVYLVSGPEPVLIDCGPRAGWDQLVGNLALLGVKITDIGWVIATHGHWDHIDNMARIHRENPKARFAIHAGDAQTAISDDRVFSCAEPLYRGVASEPIRVDRVLFDGDVITAGGKSFRIVHTPGHTPGSITVVTEIAGKRVGFCGDSVTGFYSATNRSSLIDWQNSMTRLLKEDLDLLYAGHRKRPVAGKEEIHAYLNRSLRAATVKRAKLAREENYDDLVYAAEHESDAIERPAGTVLESAGMLAGLEKAPTGEDRDRLGRAMVGAGLRWTRQTFEWRVAEKTPGVYDWAPFDLAVGTARRYGLEVLGVILTTPFGNAPVSDDELKRFAGYVGAVVGRYKDRVHHWEIWNEPNLRMFWSPRPDPKAYGAALRVAYDAAKRADPSCKIVGMSTLGTDLTFTRGAMAAGAARSFDILAVHPYRDMRDMDLANCRPEVTMREDVAATRRLLAEFGRGDVPIWFTEMGRNSSTAPEGEGATLQEQADYTVRMHVMAMATGVERLFQYELYAPAAAATNKEWHYGVLNPDYSPKPAYTALQTMAAKLAGLRWEGAFLPEDSAARGYVFGDGKRQVLVAWALDGPCSMSVPASSEGLRVTAIDGRERALHAAGALAALSLSSSPVFVEGMDPRAVRRACSLSPVVGWEQAIPGAWSPVTCTITNTEAQPMEWSLAASFGARGAARVETPRGRLAVGASCTVSVMVRPPSNAAPGAALPLDLALRWRTGAGPAWSVGKTVRVPVDAGWLLCGPFPNPGPAGPRVPGAQVQDTGLFVDHLAPVGGEARIEPVEGQTCAGAIGEGKTATWKRHRLDQRGFIDMRHSFDVRRNATAYAFRRIYSTANREARLRIGSDDGIRVWLNHLEVFRKHVHREAYPGQDEITVPLRRGWNALLIKVDQGSWGWGAYMDIDSEPAGIRMRERGSKKPLPMTEGERQVG